MLVDRIRSLDYKLVFTNTISARSPYLDGDARTYRGVLDIGLPPSTD
jgi:hypothetical protein